MSRKKSVTKENPRISVAIDSEFLKLVDDAASITGFSRSEFIRMALREKLEELSMISTLANQEMGGNNQDE